MHVQDALYHLNIEWSLRSSGAAFIVIECDDVSWALYYAHNSNLQGHGSWP